MKTTKVLFFTLLMAAMATMPKSAVSQVTIGADQAPRTFSVLELISNNKGLRLPQLTTLQRKALSDAHGTEEAIKGLTVYNTIKNCVEYWNGTEWIHAGTCQPIVEIPAPACTQPIPPVLFMTYNLGADPSLDTPKKQMNYLATNDFDPLDANVYGGLFQWGRGYDTDQALPEQRKVGWKHAVQLDTLSDGTITARKRRFGTGSTYGAENRPNVIAGNGYDTNGQPNSPNNVLFVTSTVSQWSSATTEEIYKFWGNGKLVAEETLNSGVICADCTADANGKYFQSTTWVTPRNNPCPSGFRIPTQDEWERIGAYDCQPNFAGGSINGITATGKSNGKGLRWVPVACGAVSGNCKAEVWENNTRSGYAIYTDADWTANSSYTTDLTNPLAKEPLLFLPAAGYRGNEGDQFYVGSNGYYWSSTVKNSQASYNLGFQNIIAAPSDSSNRVLGFSVRCVAE
ncbi:MAG: fibrobacter succinogenes major paralogous domain-containing protein [Prevotellaceae bacterium]|nr:fibrobacter succinogenes major paralogous domain-containing protein [Prevotellaceae bacterium]